ncbi:MAG: HEPN domain-containing protein [Armatimonadetes bacterium]|nr:HEPN domain-containing protein [Armatimonadota bacterium]
MSEADESVIRYRLERARETLDEARSLAATGHWNGCANRLYYACFYALVALLHRRGLPTRKHTGVRALFNQHFVKPGLVASDLGDFFNDLFDTRHEADYEDLVRLTEEDVRAWVVEAERFIGAITALATSRAGA